LAKRDYNAMRSGPIGRRKGSTLLDPDQATAQSRIATDCLGSALHNRIERGGHGLKNARRVAAGYDETAIRPGISQLTAD